LATLQQKTAFSKEKVVFQEINMILDCPNKCGNRIVVKKYVQGKSYICTPCWKALFETLHNIIVPSPPVRLKAVASMQVSEKVS
jgi:DNA-directed RNA polymerase subunit RPC12/RpoP